MRRAALLAALACAACTSANLAPPRLRTRVGKRDPAIHRVVALGATCGSLNDIEQVHRPSGSAYPDSFSKPCPTQQVSGVDASIRSFLEFHGYRVIDSERLNATTVSRLEVRRRRSTSWGESSSVRVELRGTRFEDATPAMQDEILGELGADALLSARIWVGAGKGASRRRDVEVLIRMLHIPSGELAWATRCRVEAGMETNDQPIMKAARCAVEAATRL